MVSREYGVRVLRRTSDRAGDRTRRSAFFFVGDVGPRWNVALGGLASGIMLSASVFGLIFEWLGLVGAGTLSADVVAAKATSPAARLLAVGLAVGLVAGVVAMVPLLFV